MIRDGDDQHVTIMPVEGMAETMERAADDMVAIAEEHNLAAVVLLLYPGHAQLDLAIGPEWSAVYMNDKGLVDAKGTLDELSNEQLANTVAMYDFMHRLLSEQAAQAAALRDSFASWAGVIKESEADITQVSLIPGKGSLN